MLRLDGSRHFHGLSAHLRAFVDDKHQSPWLREQMSEAPVRRCSSTSPRVATRPQSSHCASKSGTAHRLSLASESNPGSGQELAYLRHTLLRQVPPRRCRIPTLKGSSSNSSSAPKMLDFPIRTTKLAVARESRRASTNRPHHRLAPDQAFPNTLAHPDSPRSRPKGEGQPQSHYRTHRAPKRRTRRDCFKECPSGRRLHPPD